MAEVSVPERLLFLAAKLDVVAAQIAICGIKRAAADLDAVAARLRALALPDGPREGVTFAQDEESSS